MKLIWLPIAAVSMALFLLGGAPQEDVATPAEEVMWRKLDLTHDSLDGLVLDDFEALEAYAEDLVMLAEAGERIGPDTEAYRTASGRFRRAAEALGRAARERDVEAASLAYVDLTLGCIQCHTRLGVLPPR